MRRKNYIKKNTTSYDKNNFFFLRKSLIKKNLIDFIFFKNMKLVEKKKLFLNYNFYNFFIFMYKNFNKYSFFKNFKINSNNIKIFNKNINKKYFFLDLIKYEIFKNKSIKMFFLNKKFNNDIFINNVFFLNKNIDFNNEFFKNNFLLIENKFSNDLSKNYFLFYINFNIFMYKIIEFYKLFILLFLIK